MKIIAGLGNPGPKYLWNRHNIGFMTVDALAEKFRASAWGRDNRALTARARLGGEEALLVKPQTYMNLSGEAVAPFVERFRLSPSDLIVVHDDLDLPLGGLRIRKSGGDGGHNGVASIIHHLDTGSFIRIKLGIGRPPEGMNPADYVLSDFVPDEEGLLRDVLGQALSAVLCILHEGPERAMNRFNRKVLPGEGTA